ncbi:polysaccharide deacetylase family protein [Candidatus Saganbacteria bacterium]|nr:polysaccharide deacetylase family protein [Candidatus Saganbacteria bacterium]
MINAISGGNAIGNDLTITFDDGYENVLEIASPLLLKYGMTASVYVNPKLIDQTEAGEYKPAWWDIIDNLFNETTAGQFTEVFEKFDIGFRREKSLAKIKIAMEETLKELPAAISARIAEELQCRFSSQMKEKAFPRLMTWGQLQQLSNKGFEIGAHTMSHLSVASLPEEKYEYELVECKKTIESRLGIKVESFAFPYGGDKHFNFNSLKVLKDAGYLCALLVSGSADDQFCLSRISIHKNDDFQMFKIKVAGIYEDFASIYRKINNIWKRN